MSDLPPIDNRRAGDEDGDGNIPGIEPIEIQEEMERSFLDYAMSVIVSRALPDARDGLKPVHRRILWDMETQGFRPDRSFVKSARVTGDTMGNFHPHGNSAIYDALVRMAQPFSLRHPLISFHGNYGSPDFGAAAERYTECKLHPLAMQLLASIDENTVDFMPNYDGSNTEPTVLPARFPNLLVNGSQGIAVGMATNIPPHNLGEVIDATQHLLAHPDATPDDLMEFVKGPDFPTGGQILGRAGAMDAYRTGRGSVRMRAKAAIEEMPGKRTQDRYQIVVTELPYQVSATTVLGRVKELVDSQDLDGIADANDETSERTGTRVVFELKKDANPQVVLNNLFKLTTLQTSFGINMVALVDGIPRTLNLRDALVAYIDHQVEVVTRRTQHRLDKALARAHILEGLIRAVNIIDEIIALVRASEDRGDAREKLMVDPFSFSEIQANFILSLQLGQLTRLARVELINELDEKRAMIAELQSILDDDVKLRKVIADELAAVRAEFATPRVCEITYDPGEMSIEDLVDDLEIVVTMTKAQYIKSVDATAFKTQGRGGRGVAGAKLKEDDVVTHVLHTSAHAYLLFFSDQGKVYRLRGHELPMRDRTARGLPIVNLLNLAAGEKIQSVIDTRDYETHRFLLFVTQQGQIKKTLLSEYDKSRREGFIAISLKDDDKLVEVLQCNGTEDILMVSRQGMGIRFTNDDEQVRPMGRGTAGVRGMKLKVGDEVVAAAIASDENVLLLVTQAGFGKRTKLNEFSPQGRGGQGVRAIKLVAKRGLVQGAYLISSPDDEVMLVSSGGVVIRMGIDKIGHAPLSREAMGVKIMALDEGQSVASVALIQANAQTEE
jgi:DNA gyrase subunit A